MMKIKGQAIVEFVLSLWIFFVALSAFLAFTRMALARQKLLQIAQLGNDLQALRDVPESEVDRILSSEIGKISPQRPWQVQVERGRFRDTSAAAFYNLVVTRLRWPFENQFLKVIGLPAPVLSEMLVIEKENADDP